MSFIIYLTADAENQDCIQSKRAMWDECMEKWYVKGFIPKGLIQYAPERYEDILDNLFSPHQLSPYELEFYDRMDKNSGDFEDDLYDVLFDEMDEE